MSLNAILNTSLSGLFANQASLRATSNNIANVNTPNYSRVSVEQYSLVTQGQSAGVGISGIKTVIDKFLTEAQRRATSNTSEFTAQREFHDRLQGLLGDPASNSSLSSRIDSIFQTLADLTLNPADVLRRQQSLSHTQTFLDQVSLYHTEIQNLRSEASQQIAEDVVNVNQKLERIFDLNQLIAKQNSAGGDTGGLEGQLATVLSELSELMDVKVNYQPSGNVHVSTGNGYPLVDTSLSQLEYSSPGIVSAGTIFSGITISRVDADTLEKISSDVDITANIQSGSIAGLMEMRDVQLPNLSEALGELSAHMADEFNAVHNSYSATPPPNSLTGTPTLVDGSHLTNFTGEVTFAVVDGSDNSLVNRVTIDFDSAPASTYTFDDLVTAVNAALGTDGTLDLTDGVMSFTAGSSGHGVAIVDDLDNPSQRAGRGFSHFFGMNNLIEADSTGIFETGISGSEAHGMGATETIQFRITDASRKEVANVTVSVTGTSFDDMINELNDVTTGLGAYMTFSLDSNGELTWTETASYQNLNLQVVSDNTQISGTGLSFTEAFGIGNKHLVNASKNVSLKSEIASDPTLMALSQLDLTASIGDVVLTNGDQRGALALQELNTILVNFGDAGELNASALTLTQYVARFLGNAGLQASRASNFEEDNLALQEELRQRNADVSGVNLDEELANLVIYQNAYNAAARILSSVQELYDSLLAAV